MAWKGFCLGNVSHGKHFSRRVIGSNWHFKKLPVTAVKPVSPAVTCPYRAPLLANF